MAVAKSPESVRQKQWRKECEVDMFYSRLRQALPKKQVAKAGRKKEFREALKSLPNDRVRFRNIFVNNIPILEYRRFAVQELKETSHFSSSLLHIFPSPIAVALARLAA